MKSRYVFALALGLLGGFPAAVRAERFPEPAATLIELWMDANGRCRGGSGDAAEAACDERARLSPRIDRLGFCYGKQGQIGAAMKWHKCGPGSLRKAG